MNYKITLTNKVDQIMVIVVAAGMRKEGSKIDVYETLKKLLRSKMIK